MEHLQLVDTLDIRYCQQDLLICSSGSMKIKLVGFWAKLSGQNLPKPANRPYR